MAIGTKTPGSVGGMGANSTNKAKSVAANRGPQTKTFYFFYTMGPDGKPQVTKALTNAREVLSHISDNPGATYIKYDQTSNPRDGADNGGAVGSGGTTGEGVGATPTV